MKQGLIIDFVIESSSPHRYGVGVLIHPFREGNGRVSRVLAILMALQAGLPLLDFSIMNEQKEQYFAAVQVGLERDYQPMEAMFDKVIESSGSANGG